MSELESDCCQDVRPQLSAWLDGELSSEEAERVATRVAACEHCAAAVASMRRSSEVLVDVLGRDRVAAAAVAERVVDLLPTVDPQPSVVSEPARSRFVRRFAGLLAAAVAGFLLAAIVFQPWRPPRVVHIVEPPLPSLEPSANPPDVGVARLVLSTGPVGLRNGEGDWGTVPDFETFSCPPDSNVRTGSGTRAELETVDGCLIRLNDETELLLRSGTEVELIKGQIWCRSPEDVVLEVAARSAVASTTASPPKWSCTGAAEWTAFDDDRVRVVSSVGLVQVMTVEGDHRLTAGETATVDGGRLEKPTRVDDPLLATRWIQPILTRKGHGDDELRERVNSYLAKLGHTKLSYMYEDEIRTLGEYSADPLLQFLRSPISTRNAARRRRAAAILADVAPAWMVGDLVELLGDEDPDVRTAAAAALRRLTGTRQVSNPDVWGSTLEECRDGRARWAAWWNDNGDRFPDR